MKLKPKILFSKEPEYIKHNEIIPRNPGYFTMHNHELLYVYGIKDYHGIHHIGIKHDTLDNNQINQFVSIAVCKAFGFPKVFEDYLIYGDVKEKVYNILYPEGGDWRVFPTYNMVRMKLHEKFNKGIK